VGVRDGDPVDVSDADASHWLIHADDLTIRSQRLLDARSEVLKPTLVGPQDMDAEQVGAESDNPTIFVPSGVGNWVLCGAGRTFSEAPVGAPKRTPACSGSWVLGKPPYSLRTKS
jgi:hypothetical protein